MAAKTMDKMRLLASTDVKYGSPQYFIHRNKPDGPMQSASGGYEPYSRSPDVSRNFSQHLLVFRGQDPKPLPQSDPNFRSSGAVMVQDAFDASGRLRTATDTEATTRAGVRVKSWPVHEADGSIYVFFGENKEGVPAIGESSQTDRGIMLPGLASGKASLRDRLTKGSRELMNSRLQKEIDAIDA
eukprot:CAMPEP_0173413016 /NCGR_PEP_ID=MMETSP1356-20130122/80942_1 /TAXON_ID=77927 ORGANISM="Hemiselmis virescens, Strain PCC157" /NCGR_SAMPLE_ID=MMETSP1356 /ASSEMBLY_ACC=CAM_ASM_000847 /LENGTH=184 /DNA_ID=CAMNT_0014374989 /DNA_START=54 /DNA_END=604 /DNA_ORIENTATION=-